MTDFDELAKISETLLSTGVADAAPYVGLKERTEKLTDDLLATLYPCHLSSAGAIACGISWLRSIEGAMAEVFAQVSVPEPEKVAGNVIRRLPEIKDTLDKDVRAAFEGDPAAISIDEVILTYPALTAIGTYRLAHAILTEGVPLIPRIMSEYAHRLTGIDIHPGAKIGAWFFIDHGTGVVIGETTTIGEHVKLYQHVTIGAKSFDANPDGTLVKGVKRHPDIGNNVIIYAGATILGGDTIIGDGAVIGGNVWLTHSVAPGETVQAKPASLTRKQN